MLLMKCTVDCASVPAPVQHYKLGEFCTYDRGCTLLHVKQGHVLKEKEMKGR